jgi:hypothetical protein
MNMIMNAMWLIQPQILLQVNGLTTGRAAALLPIAFALVSLIVGGITLSRASLQPKYARTSAIAALAGAAIALLLSGNHLSRSITQSIGSGSGRLGATVAFILGIIALIIAVLALLRVKSGTKS